MAKYDHLPIYKKALELTVYVEDTVKNFSRFHKYAIGARLRDACWEIVTTIVKANNTQVAQRRELLVKLRDKAEEIVIALTVAKELKAFSSFNSFQHAAKLALDLSRQSEGWLKSAGKPSSPES
jgi:hypothetical protein